jgi:hypothetical protein
MEMGMKRTSVPILSRVFAKQSKVHLKHGLQKSHIRTLVQTNLVFPEVYENHF